MYCVRYILLGGSKSHRAITWSNREDDSFLDVDYRLMDCSDTLVVSSRERSYSFACLQIPSSIGANYRDLFTLAEHVVGAGSRKITSTNTCTLSTHPSTIFVTDSGKYLAHNRRHLQQLAVNCQHGKGQQWPSHACWAGWFQRSR